MTVVTIPPTHFHTFMTASGLDQRLAMVLERFAEHSLSREQGWDRTLEIEHLFATTPFPEPLALTLLEQLDVLDTPVMLRIEASQAVCGHAEWWPATTHHDILAAIAYAWARSLYWTLDSAVPQPIKPWLQHFAPAIAVLEPPTSDLIKPCRWERRPCGDCLKVDDSTLATVLHQLEHSAPATPAELLAAAHEAAWVRYVCGALDNQRSLPEQAGAFFAALAQSPAAALPSPLQQLAQRATEREDHWLGQYATAQPPSAQISPRVTHLRPQQLIGSAAAPGQACGVVRYVHSGEPDTVWVCSRLCSTSLQSVRLPAAVIEHHGGGCGLGAQLARRAGLPCVSGVSDLALLPPGIRVSVDGDLGLVTLTL